MLCNSIKYAEKVEESKQVGRVKNLLANQATEFIPTYYAVLYYGKSYEGKLLKPSEYRKRWNREEVLKTHNFISKKLRDCFGAVHFQWFLNRHSQYEDNEGNCKKGSFHSDLYIGEISNAAIEQPSNALLTLMFSAHQRGYSINIEEIGIDQAKILLLEMCIRQAKWVGVHKNSLFIEEVPIEEFHQTFHYGMKDICEMDDFNSIVDWKNSSFYRPTSTTNGEN
mgnify:CR=1 FL=1